MTKTELDIIRADIAEISAKVDQKLGTTEELHRFAADVADSVLREAKKFLQRVEQIDQQKRAEAADRRDLGRFQAAMNVLAPETIFAVVEALNQATDAEKEAVAPIASWFIETLNDEKRQRLIGLLQKKVGAR